ncbi:MAG: hypothetical protein M3R68_01805, partial [Acidobacteriota bacterium]|nr:hypothetical protein [Acidobacteriota bacterium]
MNSTKQTTNTPLRLAWPKFVGATLCVLLYLAASFFTRAYFMGDTMDYAQSIVMRTAGRDYFFWEFGHLLWRPLGFVLFRVFAPLTRQLVGPDAQTGATLVLIGLSWIGGLVSVLSLFGVLNRFCRSKWAIAVTMAGFISAQAFLNYLHTGAPYIPGLALLLLAMYLLIVLGNKDKPSWLLAVFAGASLAGSGLLWLPYVLAIPAALLAPLMLVGFSKQRLKLSILAAMVGAIIGGAVYFAVMTHSGVHNVQELRAWMQKTSRSTGSS